MAINSRAKGARFERTLAGKLRDHGYDCRRGQQYCIIVQDGKGGCNLQNPNCLDRAWWAAVYGLAQSRT